VTRPSRRLHDELFAAPALLECFSDRARVQGMLDFEAALARAEAEAGVIPAGAAARIAEQCRAEHFDLDELAASAVRAGNVAIPLVHALTSAVAREDPAAARYVHFGATSQDAMDTGLVLELRAALDWFDAELGRLNDTLAALAWEHRSTWLLGRTWLQPAPPVTFGMKAAGWLSATLRSRERLLALRRRVLVLELGGAAGTLASLGEHGLDVATRLAGARKLTLPELPWHAERDRLAELASALGILTGSLGKFARDVALLLQSEVGEVSAAAVPGRGGSSTMPHKQNPVGAAVILAAATRVPALVATLLSGMTQEHERGLGGWQAEWDTLPELCLLASGALAHALELARAVDVDARRMRANFEATGGVVLGEAVALALAPHLGRPLAHALVERACRRAAAEGLRLVDVLAAEREVTSHLSSEALEALCDPERYLGLAETWVDRVLESHARRPSRDEPCP